MRSRPVSAGARWDGLVQAYTLRLPSVHILLPFAEPRPS